VICAAGVRAARAAEALVSVGAEAVVLEGGMRAILGHPLVMVEVPA